MKIRRGLVNIIRKLYRNKESLNQYGRINLFTVSRGGGLLQNKLTYLPKWVNSYWKISRVLGESI